MSSLRVEHLRARVRGPVVPARADATLRRVLDDALSLALEQCGVREHEVVCIRRAGARAHVDLRASDAAVAAELGAAVGAALIEAIRHGVGVVRYGSREHALVDLLCGVAAQDHERAWAWRTLGLWRTEDGVTGARAFEECVRALVAMPRAAVPALREVARRGALAPLVRRAPAQTWLTVVRVAMSVYGTSTSLAREDSATRSRPDGTWRARAARLAEASLIAKALEADDRSFVRAAFAVLETEPLLLLAPSEEVRALLSAVTDALPDVRHDAPAARARAATARTRASDRGDASMALEPETRPIPDVRRRGSTRYGGLLFLLNVVSELGIPHRSATEPPLADRPLRWTLHVLALALVPARPDDPAVLAFAGLAPDAEPPSSGAEPPSDEERAALEGLATRVSERVRERLDRGDEPLSAVLSSTCLREGEVLAEPGWIEVRLRLESVSTALRRAGLDVDPGWLKWLGTVVRFVYE